jgi:hypothetical protein
VSGVTLLFGEPTPGSIDAALNPAARYAWALLLTLGSVLVLLGTTWPGNDRDALIIEQIGMVAVGFGTLVYGAAIFAASTEGRGTAAALTLGFGFASLRRVVKIQRTFQAATDGQGDHLGGRRVST